MERVAMTAQKREPNKGMARRLRTAGRIPGVLYGRTVKPVAVSVDRRELEKATKTHAGMNVMIDLTVEGGDSGLAFIRDYQADPFRRDFTHVDFQAISLDEELDLEIPIRIVGEALGVKEGGVLVQQRHTLEVRAKPDAIPDMIEIDISGLDVNDSIHADDIKLPAGVKFPHTVNFSVVAVVPPTKEEVVVPTAVEGAAVEGVAAEGAAAAPAAGAEKKEGAEAKKE